MASRPNLIFLFADALRFCAVGRGNGFDPVLTPNLNKLASQGATMTHAVSNYPVCSPYRAMLMTGQYPFRNGVTGNCCTMPGCERNYLRPQAKTFTDALAAAGYGVGYVGKWHLEKPVAPFVGEADNQGIVWNEFTPPGRRHGIGFWCGYNSQHSHFKPEYWITGMPRTQRRRVEKWSPEFETDVGLAFLVNEQENFRRNADPFALFMSFNPPHMPLDQVPPELLELYAGKTPADLLVRGNVDLDDMSIWSQVARRFAANYFAMISGIDMQVGRMMTALDQMGLAGDTCVVFTADHGDMLGSQKLMYKGYAYEESIRVPFVARLPGRIPAGRASDALLGAPDVMPTVLDAMNLSTHIPTSAEGKSRAGELRGDGSTPRPDSAFLLNVADEWRGIRTDRHTFVVSLKDPSLMQLFDIVSDPFQQQNLAADRPALVHTLRERTLQWMTETSDPAAFAMRAAA